MKNADAPAVKREGEEDWGKKGAKMTTFRTRVTFRVDTWTPDGESIVEQMGGPGRASIGQPNLKGTSAPRSSHDDRNRGGRRLGDVASPAARSWILPARRMGRTT
jgi:hypothetical protein